MKNFVEMTKFQPNSENTVCDDENCIYSPRKQLLDNNNFLQLSKENMHIIFLG